MLQEALYPNSLAREELTIQSPPAVVAEVCVEVLEPLVKITTVDRTVGKIAGEWASSFAFFNRIRGTIEVRISSVGDTTHLAVVAEQAENAFTDGQGAQDLIAEFLRGVQQHSKISGETTLALLKEPSRATA